MISLDLMCGRDDLVVVVERVVTVTVMDVSPSGCVLESSRPIRSGTVGTLSVEFNATEYRDPVRVTRSQPRVGAGERFQLGVEFVWLAPPETHSLRRLAQMLVNGAVGAIYAGRMTSPQGLLPGRAAGPDARRHSGRFGSAD